MKFITKLYLKNFLIVGISFGLIMSLWDYFDNETINIWKLVFQSALFGGLTSWSNVTAVKRSLLKPGMTEVTEADYKNWKKEVKARKQKA